MSLIGASIMNTCLYIQCLFINFYLIVVLPNCETHIYTYKEKGTDLPSVVSLSLQAPAWGQVETRNLELHLGLPGRRQGPRHLTCTPLLARIHSQVLT